MKEQKKLGERLYYLDGLKGLFCYMILLGHFWCIYGYQDPVTFHSPGTNQLMSHWLVRQIVNGHFWLYGYMVISGYLLSLSRVTDVFSLILKTAARYLRLFLPVLGACAGVYLIQELIGFHNGKTADYFSNGWYQHQYAVSFSASFIWQDALNVLNLGTCLMVSPFWVLRDMFLVSQIIYVCSLSEQLLEKLVKRRIPVLAVFFLLWTWRCKPDTPFMAACMAGYLVGTSRDAIRTLLKKSWGLGLFAAVLALGFYLYQKKLGLPYVTYSISFITIFWCVVLILFHRFPGAGSLFSGRFFRFLGKLNFGVYAFHWPMMCSVGALALLVGLKNQWTNDHTLLFGLLATLVSTTIAAWLFSATVENASGRGIRYLTVNTENLWKFVLERLHAVWTRILHRFS